MGEGITLVQGHDVHSRRADVHNDPRGAPARVQGKALGILDVQGGDTEVLEEDLREPLALRLWGEGPGGDDDGVLEGPPSAVVERVVEELSQPVEIHDQAALHRAPQGEDPLHLCLVADVRPELGGDVGVDDSFIH